MRESSYLFSQFYLERQHGQPALALQHPPPALGCSTTIQRMVGSTSPNTWFLCISGRAQGETHSGARARKYWSRWGRLETGKCLWSQWAGEGEVCLHRFALLSPTNCRLGGLNSRQFLTVLEAGKSKIECQQEVVRSHFLTDSYPLTSPHRAES